MTDELLMDRARQIRLHREHEREIKVRDLAARIALGEYGSGPWIRVLWRIPLGVALAAKPSRLAPLGRAYEELELRVPSGIFGPPEVAQMLVEEQIRGQLDKLGL